MTLLILSLAACGETKDGSGATGGSPAATTGGASGANGGSGGATIGDGGGGAGAQAPRAFFGAVAAASGLYVAAGEVEGDFGTDSIILTSDDGVSWRVSYRGGDELLASVAYGGGQWVAVGWGIAEVSPTKYTRSRSILVSEDANTWHPVSSPESEGFHQVIWTGSEFLLVGNSSVGSTLWASADGSEWVQRGAEHGVSGLAMGKPGLVAFGNFSDDAGATWQPWQTLAEDINQVLGLWPEGDGFSGSAVYRCCFGEEPWSDEYYSLRSLDGVAWDVQRELDPLPSAVARRGETWVGVSARYDGLLYRNADTPVWTASGQAGDVVAAGDRFIAVTNNDVWSSDDGVSWTASTLPALE